MKPEPSAKIFCPWLGTGNGFWKKAPQELVRWRTLWPLLWEGSGVFVLIGAAGLILHRRLLV
jgi:hypothetical protein